MSLNTILQNSRTALLSAASISVIASLALSAPAANARTGEATYTTDEIVVTARKREESLQDVPLAITAFTESDIKERSLTELENVAMLTPGLTFEDYSNGGYGAPVIRGASQLRIDQLEQNVSVFYDGIYIPRQYVFDLGMTNIQRIEVVKGPQSALYGANSFSGAINYVSKDRDMSEISGNVTAGMGLDGLFEANGYVSYPIIEDKLAVSVSGAVSVFDGDWDNAFPGASGAPDKGTDDSVGGWDKNTFAVGATFQEGIFTAKLDYSNFDALNEDGPHYRLNASNSTDFNCALTFYQFQFDFQAICGEIAGEPQVSTSGIDGLLIDPRAYLEVETDIIRGELNADVSDKLALTYIYGSTESEVFSLGESSRDTVSGTAGFSIFTYGPQGTVDYSTHEIRADYELFENVNLLVGAFFLDGEDVDRFGGGFAPLNDLTEITTPVLPLLNDNTSTTETTNNAIFGSVEFPLSNDLLQVSVEGRYSEVEKVTDGITYSNNSFTPRVSVDMNVTDNNLLYASYAKGEKSGGVNSSSVVLEADEIFYDEDENTTFEIGSKNTFADGRAAINAAIYHIQWDNLQATFYPTNAGSFTSGIVGNFGAASSKGFEIDGQFQLSEAFALNAGLSYVDATFDSGTSSTRFGGICDDIVCDTILVDTGTRVREAADISGNKLARVPEFQWTIGGQYDGKFKSEYDYFLRADIAGQSQQFAEEANLATLPERVLTNVRGGISKGPISADLWVTNLFDEEYVTNAFFFSFAFGTEYIPTYGAKRRGGVTLSYEF